MGWRDTQAKVESGALNFRRSARSNSDYFFDAASSSFSDAFRTRKAEEAEADRYKRNRKDQLEDYDRTLADQMAKEKREIARENEKIRLKKFEEGLTKTAEQEEIVKKRRKLATKLLTENNMDTTNPNFMGFAMDHLSAYGDSFDDAKTNFAELSKRMTILRPAEGPTVSGETLDVTVDDQMAAIKDATADRIAFDAPNPNADFKFENLKKDTYLGAAQDAENGGNLELAQKIRDYGKIAFTDKAKANKLTDSDYAYLYAAYDRDRSSNDPAIKAAAEKWFNEEEESLRKGIEAAALIGKEPAKGEIVYVMTKGRRILARKDDENNYIPIDPNFGDKILKADVNRVDTEDNIAVLQKALNAVSTQTKAQRDKMNAATTVAKEGYDITQMVKKTPIVLTIVGSARTAIGGVRQEADALFNILGENAQKNLDQGTVLEKMYKYLDNSKGITDEEIAAYKNFSAAMVRYVFAAGKALGQEGNGFSNQDYNNIKNAMFAGKGIEGFEQNLQTFARQRMADATQSAITLRDSGQIQFAKSLGVVFGSDVYTAQEHFENNYKEDAPDYYGWATTVADVVQQPKVKDTPKDGNRSSIEEQYTIVLDYFDERNQKYDYFTIADALRKKGHTEEDLKEVMGENYVSQVETGDE
jgi:hypothetical protein